MLVFATTNKNKIKEIKSMTDMEIVSLEDLNINVDVVEDGKTFSENATKKATEIMKVCGKTVMADDSGLEIDYLNGEPGIYSARYLDGIPYDQRNLKIIEKLQGVKQENRTARFVCAIAVAYPNGEVQISEGKIEGYISFEPKGNGGFGYDPIFFAPEFGKTLAEVPSIQKNSVSHRGKALKMALSKLKKQV